MHALVRIEEKVITDIKNIEKARIYRELMYLNMQNKHKHVLVVSLHDR